MGSMIVNKIVKIPGALMSPHTHTHDGTGLSCSVLTSGSYVPPGSCSWELPLIDDDNDWGAGRVVTNGGYIAATKGVAALRWTLAALGGRPFSAF